MKKFFKLIIGNYQTKWLNAKHFKIKDIMKIVEPLINCNIDYNIIYEDVK